MKLPLIKRIPKEDLSKAGGEIPKWIDALLVPLNAFIEAIASVLQGRLTFEDNFMCNVITQDFTHSVPLEINPRKIEQRNLRVTGVIPLKTGNQGLEVFKWEQMANGNIRITYQFDGGIATTTDTCTILILLG